MQAGGLTSAAAERVLGQVGPNLPPDRPPRSTLKRVADQLRDPMLLLLQAAAVLSAVLQDWPSTAIIVLVVLFNTTLGVLQQRRADHVMAELALLSAPTARVRRDGRVVQVPVSNLVPGDHVLLAGGDLVPADAVVIEAHSLDVDESPVTGESLAVRREDQDEVVSGTRVTAGRAVVQVTRTGADSSLGRIAALLLDSEAQADAPPAPPGAGQPGARRAGGGTDGRGGGPRCAAGASLGGHGARGPEPHGGRRPGVPARGGDHRPGRRRPQDGPAQRRRTVTARRRDARVGDGRGDRQDGDDHRGTHGRAGRLDGG